MARLIDVEQVGGLTHKTYVHNGDDNKDLITTHTSQDVEPIFKRAKELSQTKDKNFRSKAVIAGNVVNEACYNASKLWGVSPREAFQELVNAKTDRAKSLWKVLTEGRDFRKFQAKHYS